MKIRTHCPKCGTPLSEHAHGESCPRCSLLGAISLGDELQPDPDDEPPLSSTHRDLDDYELLEEIGRGGMGVVFKARQKSLNRIVAVKMLLHGRFANTAFRRRFGLEAEAAAHLEHPNIVPIHEVGEHAGQPFFSMGWIDGDSLDRELADGPLPPDRCAHLVATLAHAVHHAHVHGILHRDLKPHNVIIDADGEPHLTDFGLAKLLDDDSGLTLSETVLGSPGFVAPEQAAGENSAVTTASDVFSLGAMLFAMLTGEPPFTGETPLATLHKVIASDPPRPRALVPSLPRDLETICLKCLQKEPARRYRSAEALAVDLERWMRNEPILARPVSDVERVWLWCRRRPWRAGLIAALIFAVLAGGIGITSQWRRAEDASRRWKEAALKVERDAYSAQVSLAEALVNQGQFREARQTLLAAGPESLRGWEWGWIMRACNQDLMTLGPDDVRHGDCAFSPDGRIIITGDEDGAVRLWELPSGSLAQVLRGGNDAAVLSLTVSPDGRMAITTHAENPAKVWDLERKALAYSLDDPAPGITCASFSPDGETLATGDVDGRVRFWERESGTPIREIPRYEDGAVRAVAFSPDGRQLAYVGGTDDPTNQSPTSLCLLDLADGSLRQLAGHTSSVPALAFSPDGEWVATAGRDGTARITRAHGDAPLRTIQSIPTNQEYDDLGFSPDSRQLTVAAGDDGNGYINVIDLGTEGVTLRQTISADAMRSIEYSPDGRSFAATVADGTVQFWPVRPHPAFLNLEGHDGDVWAVDVSPDGQYVASGSLDQTAKIWEMQTGRLVNTIQVLFPVITLAFTADSRHLVTTAPGNTARVWPILGGDAVLELTGHEHYLRSVAVDPKGRWIASSSDDQKARLWDAATGELLRTFAGHVQSVTSLAFSPDGERLATASFDRHVIVWESQSDRQVCQVRGNYGIVSRILFSPDGRSMATASFDGFARIWDASTGDPIGLPMKSRIFGIRCIAFSPDGTRLLTTGAGVAGSGPPNANKTVALWDPASGRRLWEFTPHNAPTYAMAFSPDGTRLVTGGGDNTVRIWSVFPWRMADYPGTGETAPAARLEAFKRKYWAQAVKQAPSPDRRVEVRPWGEKNLARAIRIKTSPALPIPARPAEASDGQIDLSALYNAALNEVWQPVDAYFRINLDLAPLAPGQHAFGGVAFDVRGVIQLGTDAENWTRFPRSIEIPIGRKIRKFHVLHSAAYGRPDGGDGTVIGAYRLSFTDGGEVLHEIVYGNHLRTFLAIRNNRSDCAEAVLAWRWRPSTERLTTSDHRLYMATYENPRPEAEVTRIEFLSGDPQAAPFLVAMTVE